MRVGDSFNLHKKIKETARIVSKSAESTLTDIDGNLITNLENKFEIWQQYLEKELFHDIRPEEHKISFDSNGPPIMVIEMQNAINKSKNRKAEDPDELPIELLKTLSNSTCITRLTELFNTIYDTGYIPNDWLQSTFVAIP